MKRIALVLSLMCSANALAGSATLPTWQVDNTGDMCIRLANISNTTTTVNFDFYNNDGTIHSGTMRSFSQSGLSTSAPITLAAKQSESICLDYAGTTKIGFATINTSRADNVPAGSVISHAIYYGIGNKGVHLGWSIPVNKGDAF